MCVCVCVHIIMYAYIRVCACVGVGVCVSHSMLMHIYKYNHLVEAQITQPPVETTQLLGLDVMFDCTATGIPRPAITWSSDNRVKIMPNSTTMLDNTTIRSTILLANIAMEDFVNYTCTAMNRFNTVNASALLINASMIITHYRIVFLHHIIYCFSNTNNYNIPSGCYSASRR